MKVNIKRIDTTLPLPAYHSQGAFGFDFYSRNSLNIPAGETVLIPSNFIIQCPDNYALLVLPRSSLMRKKGLQFPHSIGLIDADYCGEDDEIMLQVTNTTEASVGITRGERLAQGLFVQVAMPSFSEQETMHAPSRGGFGSTGS